MILFCQQIEIEPMDRNSLIPGHLRRVLLQLWWLLSSPLFAEACPGFVAQWRSDSTQAATGRSVNWRLGITLDDAVDEMSRYLTVRGIDTC